MSLRHWLSKQKVVFIERSFCWGLGAYGQNRVEAELSILKSELIPNMQLAETPCLKDISRNHIL